MLFTRYNGNPNLVGVCGIVRQLERETVHPDKLIRGKVVSNSSSPYFLEIALNTGHSRHFLAKRIRTTAGQSGVAGSDLKVVPIPLPGQTEQKLIAEKIGYYFSIIDVLDKALEKNLIRAEKLRQSILKKAFEGKLVPQGPNDEPASLLLERIQAEKAQQAAEKKATKPKRKKKTTQKAKPSNTKT